MSDMKPVTSWKGLNNVGEQTRVGMEWLSVADNVDVTKAGRIESREGFVKVLQSAASQGFSTNDFKRGYVVGGGLLHKINQSPASLSAIAAMTSSARCHWAELNNDVYLSNGVDFFRIQEDGAVSSWQLVPPGPVTLSAVPGRMDAGLYQVACTFIDETGRESGASTAQAIHLQAGQAISVAGIEQAAGVTRVYITPADSPVFGLASTTSSTSIVWNDSPDMLGEALATMHMDGVPSGVTAIAMFKGRMYAAMHLPAENTSVVWASKPLQPHLFDLSEDFIMVPGEVRMLADTTDALIVGTNRSIHAYDGESLSTLASYGVPRGAPSVRDTQTSKTFMWTNRGICEALPFANLTSANVSLPPGSAAYLAIVERYGQRKLIATTDDGGTAFNQRL